MSKYFFILVTLLTLIACSDEPTKVPVVKEKTPIFEKKSAPKQVTLIANMDHLRMRRKGWKNYW
jgi:uncharacterized protein YcfL